LASDDEQASLAALYLRNREVMLRAAYVILRNHHDAEDAVSTAIVKVTARLAGGHQIDDPDAYVIQAVRNAALDQRRASMRRLGSQPESPSIRDPRHMAAGPELHADIAEAKPDIVDQIIEQQRSADLRAAAQRTMEGLVDREAVMLSMLLAGHTRTEIGSRFNLTGQRVGQLLKKPIADLLSQLGIDPPGARQQRSAGEPR
jgi:RNA polymerase sigma factor (sigma-70 family)